MISGGGNFVRTKNVFLIKYDFCKDSDKLVMGYMLVFVYVNLMLSKMNCVEQRFWLSVIGILR